MTNFFISFININITIVLIIKEKNNSILLLIRYSDILK